MAHPLHRPTRQDWLALLFVLGVAALLRFMLPGTVRFQYDEAAMALHARDMALGNSRPLLGLPTSTGLPNSPLSIYLMTVPYLFSASHLVATAFVMILNIMAIGQLWAIAFRYLGRVPAFAAGLLYATNPWAILLSRKIWTPDLLAPFVLLTAALILRAFYEGSPRAQFLVLPIWLITVQIHYAAGVLIVPLVWLAWKYRTRLARIALTFGVILGLEVLVPFGLGLLQAPPQPNPITDKIPPTGLLSWQGFQVGIEVISGLGIAAEEAPAEAGAILTAVPRPDALWMLLVPLVLFGVWTLARQRHPLAGPLTGWAFLPVLVFTPAWVIAEAHYFAASLPGLMILAGVGANAIWEILISQRVLQGIAAVGLGAIFVTQGLWFYGFLGYLETQATPSGWGPSLGRLLAVRDAARLTEAKDVLVLSSPQADDHDVERYWVWRALLSEYATCIRPVVVAKGQIAIFPAAPFTVIAPENSNNLVGADLYLDRATLYPLRFSEPGLQIAHYATAPAWPGPMLHSLPAMQVTAGVTLTDYAFVKQTLYLRFALDGPGQGQAWVRITALDADDILRAEVEAPLWMETYGCVGDNVVFSLPLATVNDQVTRLRVAFGTPGAFGIEVDLPRN